MLQSLCRGVHTKRIPSAQVNVSTFVFIAQKLLVSYCFFFLQFNYTKHVFRSRKLPLCATDPSWPTPRPPTLSPRSSSVFFSLDFSYQQRKIFPRNLEPSHLLTYTYGLLTKLVWSRWLDIMVKFFFCKRTWPISSKHGQFNRLTSVLHAYVLSLIMNFVMTLSK